VSRCDAWTKCRCNTLKAKSMGCTQTRVGKSDADPKGDCTRFEGDPTPSCTLKAAQKKLDLERAISLADAIAIGLHASSQSQSGSEEDPDGRSSATSSTCITSPSSCSNLSAISSSQIDPATVDKYHKRWFGANADGEEVREDASVR